MKRTLAAAAIAALATVSLASCTQTAETELVENPVQYVSTLVGTLSDYSLSTGNTYPATALPWGMNFWTPQTGKMGDGWGYRYDSHVIRGFKQTHQPSPWINDYGQFAVMPVRDIMKVDQDGRSSWYSHNTEIAKPYHYSVYLADHDIVAEVTPTERAAIFRATYPEADMAGFVIDAFDKGSWIKVIPEQNTVVGYTTKNSGGVPDNFCNWFVIRFDKKIEGFSVYDAGHERPIPVNGYELKADHVIAGIHFKTERREQINAKIASSFISLEQAYLNLKEVQAKDFNKVLAEGKARWNDVLGRIQVGGGTEDQYRTFYSCLYRSLLFPRKLYELNAQGKPVHWSPYNGEILYGYMYTDTGFWDTFRALFPLLNLAYPDTNAEIQDALFNISRENNFLPEWSSPGHRGCMVGNNSASVVADAMVKKVYPEDIAEGNYTSLYSAIVYGTENVHPEANSSGRLGHEYYNKLGYIPYNVGINENVARTLEYAYDDWCILQIAKKLNRPDDEIELWASRAMNYKNVFDHETNLMRGRNLDGTFQEPFSPYKWGDAFTEGNAWHYTWSVFHDIQGLIDLMGGEENFNKQLDQVFIVPPIYDDSYYGFRIHEIVEMQIANMGNYAHGNQPAQHIIYLYNYARQPWKAQWWSREVMDKLYSARPDGYCGDEDNGQTSAWYVFSALGFYPVCPVSDEYILGSPLFRKAVINLQNGKKITINAENNNADRRYVSSLMFNGKNWQNNYLKYDDLLKGATLDYVMSETANTARGIADENKPYSFSRETAK